MMLEKLSNWRLHNLRDTLNVTTIIASGRMMCVAHVAGRREIIQEYMQI